jgi:ATP-binding cassette subfamily B protein
VQESFSGIRVIKAFNRESNASQSFENESESYKNLALDLLMTDAFFQPIISVLIGISTIMTVYFGGKECIAGNISIGNIAEFVIYVNMLTWPVTSLGWVTSVVQRAVSSQERLNEFLKSEPEIKSLSNEPFSIKSSIKFDSVSFHYPDTGIKAIDDLSFEIKKGESIGIIGKTGAGKSSIANLLCRMYDPNSGRVLIDGKDLKTINLHAYRRQVGFVPQEVYLFSDSIKNNISFGLPNSDGIDMEIIRAAKLAQIYDDVFAFPDQFETLLGERGITLSGGQKQRLSIARALIKSPSFLLFDDCLSAVDTETEAKIMNELKKEMRDKFSLIVSHRVSSVMESSQIIVLDKGAVVEQGTHHQLLSQKGIYAELYQNQLVSKK